MEGESGWGDRRESGLSLEFWGVRSASVQTDDPARMMEDEPSYDRLLDKLCFILWLKVVVSILKALYA